MNMHWLDWGILTGFIMFITVLAYSTKKYSKSVADFLAANRCAGKYILAMGEGMAGFGAISLVANFQMFYEGAFTAVWWQSCFFPVSIFVAITGWVIYRFRQTRVLTMAQFFEMRYSKRFRVFAGMLCFLSGIINFGIFPSAGSRFFIYFCGLPPAFSLLGIDISTYSAVMAGLIALAFGFTWFGGQIAVLVTDFTQSVFCNVAFIVILVVVFLKFDWGQISAAVYMRPDNHSLTNPFQISGLENYDTFYYLIAIFIIFYGAYSWQGQQAYNCSAINAHEARMSKILGYLRSLTPLLFSVMLPICTYTFLHHVDFAEQAIPAQEILSHIENVENEQIRKQMTVPVAMSQILPVGILGLFCAAVFAAFITTHDTYLHSWGSIFLQDVIMPFRKKPFRPREHICYLKWSILGVAVFIFLFSRYFTQTEDILMFMALSGTIFLGGSGVVIIGGLYWRRGTTAGAWAAMLIGLFLAIGGFVLVLGWPQVADVFQRGVPRFWEMMSRHCPNWNEEKFCLTPQELFFFTTLICSVSYVVASLLTPQKAVSFERLFHRGKFAIETEQSQRDESEIANWKRTLGFEKNLMWDSKLIIFAAYAYLLISLAIVIAGSIYHLVIGIPEEIWLAFWHGYIWVSFGLMVVLTIWFGLGGFFDLKEMYKLLATTKRNDEDDGRVLNDHPGE